MNCNIEYPQHVNICNVDLVANLGNLLDNAIEAVESAEENLRFINLTIHLINKMLIIKLDNGYIAAPVIAERALKTTKQDLKKSCNVCSQNMISLHLSQRV